MRRIFLIAVLVCLAVATLAFAQGGPNAPDCHYCVKGVSYGCKETLDTDYRGCDSVKVIVPCEGQFYLCVQLVCPSQDDCQHCRAIANLWDGSTHIGAMNHGCSTSCAPVIPDQCPQVTLHPGVTYWLTVCKIRCQDHTCNDCNSQCRAVAYVYNDFSVCPTP